MKTRNRFFCIGAAVLFAMFGLSGLAMADEALTVSDVAANIDRLWVLLAAALVFFMQAGFMSFEVGCVRKKTVPSVALKNGIDWVTCSIAFFIAGYAFMFGHSTNGFIGSDLFLLSGLDTVEDAIPLRWVFFMFQVGFCGTALTIVSGALAGRVGFVSYLCVSFLMGLIIYPVFGHWAWGNLFIEGNQPWLAKLGFMDFAGSTVVHSVGAWTALVGAIMLGPRLGRYTSDGKVRKFKNFGIPWGMLGVFILWMGWWGFNGGSTLAMNEDVGFIIFNTNLAAAAAGLSAFFFCFLFQKKADLNEKFLGGILGGLVAITACCNVVSPMGAILVGLTAGVVHNYAYDLIIKKFRIDDVVGAIPVHGFCGAWGTLCVAIFGKVDMLAHPQLTQLGIQFVGIATCFVWTISAAFIIFSVLKMTVGLRVSVAEENAGINIGGTFEEESEDKLTAEDLEGLA